MKHSIKKNGLLRRSGDVSLFVPDETAIGVGGPCSGKSDSQTRTKERAAAVHGRKASRPAVSLPERRVLIKAEVWINCDDEGRAGPLRDLAWLRKEVRYALMGQGGPAFRWWPIYAQNGYTPLHFAALFGRLASARSLLDAGADPNAVGSFTPLQMALLTGRLPLVELLLERGARADLRGKFRHTPLECVRGGIPPSAFHARRIASEDGITCPFGRIA
jgi:hypothetical protein